MSSEMLSQLLAIKVELAAIDQRPHASHMQRLWQVLKAADDAQTQAVLTSSVALELKESFSTHWSNFISQQEFRRANQGAEKRSEEESILAIEDYRSVMDELESLSDTRSCSRFLMVGCGPFPETLLIASRKYGSSLQVSGIDRCANAIVEARRCSLKLGLEGATFIQADGSDFDYSDVHSVLIANGVVGKRAVLTRMAGTLRAGSMILVRAPIRLARLLYEYPFDEELPSELEQVGKIASSSLGCTHLLRKRK